MQAKLSLCKKLGSRRKSVDWQELAYIKTECNMKIRTKIKMSSPESSLAGYINMGTNCKGICTYSSTCVKWPLSKTPKIGFQDHLSLKAGQKYCRMLQREHSAILLTFFKLPFVIQIFVLFVCFVALRPSQQLWSLRDGQFT